MTARVEPVTDADRVARQLVPWRVSRGPRVKIRKRRWCERMKVPVGHRFGRYGSLIERVSPVWLRAACSVGLLTIAGAGTSLPLVEVTRGVLQLARRLALDGEANGNGREHG